MESISLEVGTMRNREYLYRTLVVSRMSSAGEHYTHLAFEAEGMVDPFG